MAAEVHGTHIRIPQGDTGAVKFVVDEHELTKDDTGVFTLVRRDDSVIVRKLIEPTIEDNAFHMAITYEDTARLKPDTYEWSFRVVRSGSFDGNGRLTDARAQHTAVLSGKLNVLAIAGGAR